MLVEREFLLRTLESVEPGLKTVNHAGGIEQSSCVVFKDGLVRTFNEEVSCCMPCGLSITGAVNAQKLIDLLRKKKDIELDIEQTPGELIVKGKGFRSGIFMEAQILLPVHEVELPGDWQPLDQDFSDAIAIVGKSVIKPKGDKESLVEVCINIHEKWLESWTRFQITRYRVKTPIREPVLVRKEAVRHIVSQGMTDFSETEGWIHFKNPGGLVLSCRRYLEEFSSDDVSKVLKVAGTPTTLPKSLPEAVDAAEIFSKENAEDNLVNVRLSAGKVRVRGEGVGGWDEEYKKAQYDGPVVEFCIGPKMLKEIVARHSEVSILPDIMKVDGGKWKSIFFLLKSNNGNGNPKEETKGKDKQEE